MDRQNYSVQFFTSFLESLQNVCRNHLNFNQFVEVSGYVCLEMDNKKKERYVLSELLQSSGNVVSESYCTKAFKTNLSSDASNQIISRPQTQVMQMDRTTWSIQRSKENIPSRHFSRTNSSQSLPEQYQMSLEMDQGGMSQGGMKNVSSWSNLDCVYSQGLPEQQERANINPEPYNKQTHVSLPVQTSRIQPHTDPTEGRFVSVLKGSGKSGKQFSLEETQQTSAVRNPTFVSKSHIKLSTSSQDEESKQFVNLTQNFSDSEQAETSVTLPPSFPELENIKCEPSVDDEDDIIDLDMFEEEEDLEDSDFLAQCKGNDSSQGMLGRTEDMWAPGRTDVMPRQLNSKKVNPGSLKVMKSAVKQFKLYHFDKYGKDIDLFATTPEELDGQLLEFFQCAKKRNGEDPTPTSLRTLQTYLDRYLKEGGYPYSINRDIKFKVSRDFIKAKVEGSSRNKVIQKPIPIDDNDVEIMFQRNVLGGHSPNCLLNSLWFVNTKYFGIRGPADHFNLKWGDIVLKTNNQGQEYLERSFNSNVALKLFAKPENPSRCFVNFYKQYRSRRPKIVLDDLSPFYLKSVKGPYNEHWFVPEAATWSCFTKMWRRMVSAAGLPLKKKIL